MRTATLALTLLALTGIGANHGSAAGDAAAVDCPDALPALDDFLRAYWAPDSKVLYRDSEHRGGLPADYWWSAQIFETFLDAERATGEHRRLLDAFYDGFIERHADWENDWNDDMGWWALALLRAFEVTGEARFRERGIALFQTIGAFEDATYGGGIWWKRNGDYPQKGVPISAPWIMCAVRIAALTGDVRYLSAARHEYTWLESRFFSPDGRVNDHLEGPGEGTVIEWGLTYNYGTWIGASIALFDATGERAFYDKAVAAARYATDHVTRDGVFQNEGDGDGAGFKMILTRSLADLAARGETWLWPVLRRNAASAWKHRRPDGLMGTDWSADAPPGAIESFAAAGAVDLLFHARELPEPASLRRLGLAVGEALRGALSRARFATLRARPAPVWSGTHPGVTAVEAEDGSLRGLGTESARRGFSGTGYVAGWGADGQSVRLRLDVPAAGVYAVVLRYSAEAGVAIRSFAVNDDVTVSTLSFPGTASWSDYRTVSVPRVSLRSGANTVELAYSSECGSSNYLNLDRVTVAVAAGAAPMARSTPMDMERSTR